MRGRGVRLVVLCEDDEHLRFVRHVFRTLNRGHRELRALVSPGGRGAAEKWVRDRYAEEAQVHRRKAASQEGIGLLVAIDADTGTVKQRHDQLSEALAESGVEPRQARERIVIWVPKRNVETWVRYLGGNAANEEDDYKHSVQGVDFRPAAQRFVEVYRRPQPQRPGDLLPALTTAYDELDRIEQDRIRR